MTVTKIDWKNIVGEKKLGNGGYFGDIMELAGLFIVDQQNKNKLTQAEAGQIYSAIIPSAIKEAIDFELKEQSINLTNEKLEQDKMSAYVSRVKLDKEAALLGLDDAVKQSKEEREANGEIDGNFIYQPKYEYEDLVTIQEA